MIYLAPQLQSFGEYSRPPVSWLINAIDQIDHVTGELHEKNVFPFSFVILSTKFAIIIVYLGGADGYL